MTGIPLLRNFLAKQADSKYRRAGDSFVGCWLIALVGLHITCELLGLALAAGSIPMLSTTSRWDLCPSGHYEFTWLRMCQMPGNQEVRSNVQEMQRRVYLQYLQLESFYERAHLHNTEGPLFKLFIFPLSLVGEIHCCCSRPFTILNLFAKSLPE